MSLGVPCCFLGSPIFRKKTNPFGCLWSGPGEKPRQGRVLRKALLLLRSKKQIRPQVGGPRKLSVFDNFFPRLLLTMGQHSPT